ncbi:Small subunit processome component [Branchiostoma belcheri]|nr:Small subunit processome component [Branchiostoma belcheri]
MKVKRQKNVRHVLSFYKNNFSYNEPYQVLIDGTFCKAALQFKVDIKEQLPKYLEGNVQLLTTSCVLAELEAFGQLMYGAFLVAKRFKPRKCGHKGAPVPAADCLLSLVKPHNEQHYFVATQDPLLTQKLKNIPAVPLLYLNKATPVLDRPSARSVAKAEGLQDTKRREFNMPWRDDRVAEGVLCWGETAGQRNRLSPAKPSLHGITCAAHRKKSNAEPNKSAKEASLCL